MRMNKNVNSNMDILTCQSVTLNTAKLLYVCKRKEKLSANIIALLYGS